MKFQVGDLVREDGGLGHGLLLEITEILPPSTRPYGVGARHWVRAKEIGTNEIWEVPCHCLKRITPIELLAEQAE